MSVENQALECTLCIVKPDAVRNQHHGRVLQRVFDEGFALLAMRMIQLTAADAKAFYAVHSEQPFFEGLVSRMCLGPVVVAALVREDAVAHWRSVVGATDPAKAAVGTLRQQLGESLSFNSVHGSDSVENGLRETAFFFSGAELGR